MTKTHYILIAFKNDFSFFFFFIFSCFCFLYPQCQVTLMISITTSHYKLKMVCQNWNIIINKTMPRTFEAEKTQWLEKCLVNESHLEYIYGIVNGWWYHHRFQYNHLFVWSRHAFKEQNESFLNNKHIEKGIRAAFWTTFIYYAVWYPCSFGSYRNKSFYFYFGFSIFIQMHLFVEYIIKCLYQSLSLRIRSNFFTFCCFVSLCWIHLKFEFPIFYHFHEWKWIYAPMAVVIIIIVQFDHLVNLWLMITLLPFCVSKINRTTIIMWFLFSFFLE